MTRDPGTKSPRYPIRAVSKLTGISIDTLRAWERRYRAVSPQRGDRGRLYSEADVSRLRLLSRAVRAGHSIGQAVVLSDAELERLQTLAVATPRASMAATEGALQEAMARFDGPAVDRELARLAAIMPPADLVRQVVLPALGAAGASWNREKGGIAREHLISAAMRHLLGSFLRLHARSEGPVRLLFATTSGDRHEIGTLSAAMLAASRGHAVTYLGPDLPASQIVDAARAAGPVTALVLGLTLSGRLSARELRTIVTGLPRTIELWVGGPAAEHHRALISTRGFALPSLDDYLEQLERLASRAA